MRGSSGYDRCEMRRKLLGRSPLIEARIRPAPHGNLAVTKRLLRQPLNDVVSIAWFICERFELAARIASAANIDECEHVTVRREVGAARMVRVGDVRRQCKDYRRLRQRAV